MKKEDLKQVGIAFAAVTFPWLHLVKIPVSFGFIWQPLTDNGYFFAPLLAWGNSLGLFGLFALLPVFFFLDAKQRKMYLPSLAVFGLANVLLCRGDPRLNIVALYPLWITAAVPAVVSSLHKWSQISDDEQSQGVIAAFCLLFFVVMSAGGVMGVRHHMQFTKPLWIDELEEAAKWIVKNTRPSDVFVSYYAPFEIVSSATGRPVFNLVPESARAAVVDRFFKSPNDPAAMISGVKYVLDCEDFGQPGRFANTSSSVWSVVFRDGPVKIYQLI
jgi:hypothetical protein